MIRSPSYRKLTRHLLICVNSFNASTYVRASLELVKSIHAELKYGGIKYTILCTYGGGVDMCYKHGNIVFVSHEKNISDHNSFHGIRIAKMQNMLPEVNMTCVFIHDSCSIKPIVFRAKMKRLSRFDITGWVFAHALGLYNIGACDFDTALKQATQWVSVSHIDKLTGIKLEHNRFPMQIGDTQIYGLRCLSNFTLTGVEIESDEENNVDFQSIGSVLKFGKQRHIVFLSAFGIFKYSHTPTSFLLPIWVGAFSPKSSNEFEALKSNPVIKEGLDWVMPLVPLNPRLISEEDST